ncbi:uncharacterized protein BX663DRAFT_259803 [Cokeromyces recurvatus]|uniref:uncharacterized protein n=1 Tax=Cokeromyces recurvatus TaxID=90255 RepID=UPI00221E45E5|nr:uncharacterized protein BX663DRAFT_259803 [Cokeromyces recurvatus]KAI7898487.1 hypothetical protein BX663DRAFT_259803 [Cokeromyces recurvatus]
MKIGILLLLFIGLVASQSSESNSAAPEIVCAMSLCPSATAGLLKREDPACPSHCADNCRIIDDVCCPGSKKAICNFNPDSANNTTATDMTTTTTTSMTIPVSTTTAAVGSATSSNNAANTATTTTTNAATTTATEVSGAIKEIGPSLFFTILIMSYCGYLIK